MPQYQGIWTLAQAAQLQSTQRWATDPLFENTTLLLQADNAANGAQNNTFLDSSSNNFTITRAGNTTQGTFTPYSATGWSNYFTGSSSYLSNTSTALIGSTVSTFTAEAWIYMTAAPTSDANNIGSVISLDGQANGTFNYMAFGPISNQKLFLRWFDGTGKTCNGSTVLALNTWYHIAVVVNSNAISMYVNGVPETLSGTTTLTNRNGTSNEFAIATNNYTSFSGYISNVRVTNTAVYTSAFTPSTIPLTSPSGTLLLTSQSNRFVDTNTQAAAKTLTPAGSATSVQAFSPFAPQYQYTPSVTGGSGYFDGSGDYLTTPSTAALSYGTSDYSQEFWIYLITSPSTFQRPLQYSDDRDNIVVESGNFNFFDGTASTISAATTGQWFHLCVTRVGGTLRGFVNGKLGFTRSGTYNSSTRSLALGATSGGANPLGGYTTNYRIVKGGIPTAYSTSSTTVGAQIFTPPTTPFTGSESLTAGSVSLLLNFTNAGIYDGTLKNNLETVGNAQVSTSVVKYGTGSMYFDGSGDWLQAPSASNQLFTLGTGNFTVECWFYRTSTSARGDLLGTYSASPTGWGLSTSLSSTADIVFYIGNTVLASTSGSVWSVDTWTHVAVVRLNGNLRIYVNGVSQASVANTTNLVVGSPLQVGAAGNSTQAYNGYIDDLRITNGIARYTANFIPPTVALPRQ